MWAPLKTALASWAPSINIIIIIIIIIIIFYRFLLVIPEKLTRYLMPFLIAKDPQLSGCYISMLEMK